MRRRAGRRRLLQMMGGLLLLIATSARPQNPVVSPKQASWLAEEVVYIATEKEKSAFRRLETDRERDLFIEAFWKQRDSVPETPENEFREEHYRRIRYANANFGKGTSRPGWKTDRGRIHIILGKPVNVNSYGDETLHLVPVEVWFYQGDFGYGLPPSFYVVFFQEEGMGDYILYSPIRHGPRKLLESFDGHPDQALMTLARIDPELAGVSRSLIPGATSTFSPQAPLSSEVILNKISVLAQKRIDDIYVDKLLKYKSLIEVDHSVSYIPSDLLLKVIGEEGSTPFVHYAVTPQRLSVGSASGDYSIRLEIYGRVSDFQGRTVHQFQKKFSFNPTPDEVREMRTKRFSYQDAFPLIPGTFKFDVLIKNPVSGEFTSAESEVSVLETATSPRLSSLILATRIQKDVGSDSSWLPFRMGRALVSPSPGMVFGLEERLFACWKGEGLSSNMGADGWIRIDVFQEERLVHSKEKRLAEYDSSGLFFEELPAQSLTPGIYSLIVSLLDGGRREVGSLKEDFSLSHVKALPPLWSISDKLPSLDDPHHFYVLGVEYLSQEQFAKARLLLEKSYARRPESLEFALGLAEACLALQEFSRVQEILVRFLERAKEDAGVFFLLGKSAFLGNDPGKAVYFFKKYLAQFGTNLEVLNMLASSLYQTGNRKEALAAWKKSLEIEPRQEDIKKKVEELERK